MNTIDAVRIRPLNHYGLCKIATADTTEGGIHLLPGAEVEAYKKAKVLALGPGVPDEPIPEGLKIGDTVAIVPGPFIFMGGERWLIPYACMCGIIE